MSSDGSGRTRKIERKDRSRSRAFKCADTSHLLPFNQGREMSCCCGGMPTSTVMFELLPKKIPPTRSWSTRCWIGSRYWFCGAGRSSSTVVCSACCWCAQHAAGALSMLLLLPEKSCNLAGERDKPMRLEWLLGCCSATGKYCLAVAPPGPEREKPTPRDGQRATSGSHTTRAEEHPPGSWCTSMRQPWR